MTRTVLNMTPISFFFTKILHQNMKNIIIYTTIINELMLSTVHTNTSININNLNYQF